MDTASILSKKSPVKHFIGIKTPAAINTTGLHTKTTGKSDYKYSKEKAIVINMFQSPTENESGKIKFTYTLALGDHKRLNSKGILTVYDFSEPINIPVVKLLGDWKKTHAGITLIRINKNWCVKGEVVKNVANKPKPAYTAFKRLLKFVMA